MLTEIVANALSRLQEKGLAVDEILMKGDVDGIVTTPAAHGAIDEGALERKTNAVFKQSVYLDIFVTFKSFESEEARRRGLYPILEGTIGILMLQTLGLSIDPLAPVSFGNVSTEEHKKKALEVFRIRFQTSFDVRRVDDEVATDLLQVGLNYYLKPGDDNVDASDEITLQGGS